MIEVETKNKTKIISRETSREKKILFQFCMHVHGAMHSDDALKNGMNPTKNGLSFFYLKKMY